MEAIYIANPEQAAIITGTATGMTRSGRIASRPRVFTAIAAKSVPTVTIPRVPRSVDNPRVRTSPSPWSGCLLSRLRSPV